LKKKKKEEKDRADKEKKELDAKIKDHLDKYQVLEVKFKKAEKELQEIERKRREEEEKRKRTKIVPVIFDDPANNFDSVLSGLDSKNKDIYLKFNQVQDINDSLFKDEQVCKKGLYFVPLSTTRLSENYDNNRFEKMRDKVPGGNLFICVINYASNASGIEAISDNSIFQIVYDSKGVLDCDLNKNTYAKIKKYFQPEN